MANEEQTPHDRPDRRRRGERRRMIDLTRVEAGLPERRKLPGVERRSAPPGEGSPETAAEDTRAADTGTADTGTADTDDRPPTP